jgi:hypothetical protein
MTDKDIDAKQYLLQYAQLHLFWIFRNERIQPGLIHYLGEEGIAYLLMDDDDERVHRCIEYLQSIKCPVFADVAEAASYEEKLRNSS